ncbi:glycosyltransferase family 9 protein [Oscillatoria sp. FACHB-1406]|uniref:glycosyltransferase family 9 protein n=1 Tax=Oscillatoria sp. FACHB-1406 TaxID=2692846 RepID=UPI0016854FF7|nr:glycosyltransferase family 9 protein [Oscillatoria sp. FACHB-1406]MBD2579507.1 glycosyltransferase family 9 protein [Oscillatoria sp. FACHB-1406]
MRILALVPGGIGDQILFFPTLETLQQNYPDATIDVLVEPRSRSAYRVCPTVSEVLVFDYKDRNGLADYLNLFGVLRDREYDLAVAASDRWTIGSLLWLNGISTRVGYGDGNANTFFTRTVPWKTEQYVAQMYHDLAGGLGIKTSCPPIKIAVPKPDIEWAEATQQRLGLKEGGYIVLHDTDNKKSDRNYPVKSWLKIVKDIQNKQPNVAIVLLQDVENAAFVAEMTHANPTLKVASPSDVGKMAALIAGANLLLCTSGGTLDLALAVGTYTIALLSPEQVKKRLPAGNDNCIAVQAPSDAIAAIPANTVLEKIWQG